VSILWRVIIVAGVLGFATAGEAATKRHHGHARSHAVARADSFVVEAAGAPILHYHGGPKSPMW